MSQGFRATMNNFELAFIFAKNIPFDDFRRRVYAKNWFITVYNDLLHRWVCYSLKISGISELSCFVENVTHCIKYPFLFVGISKAHLCLLQSFSASIPFVAWAVWEIFEMESKNSFHCSFFFFWQKKPLRPKHVNHFQYMFWSHGLQ